MFSLISMQKPAILAEDIKRLVGGSEFRSSDRIESTTAKNLLKKTAEPVRVRKPSPFYKGMKVEALKVHKIAFNPISHP